MLFASVSLGTFQYGYSITCLNSVEKAYAKYHAWGDVEVQRAGLAQTI